MVARVQRHVARGPDVGFHDGVLRDDRADHVGRLRFERNDHVEVIAGAHDLRGRIAAEFVRFRHRGIETRCHTTGQERRRIDTEVCAAFFERRSDDRVRQRREFGRIALCE
jgi:hypothetical protein